MKRRNTGNWSKERRIGLILLFLSLVELLEGDKRFRRRTSSSVAILMGSSCFVATLIAWISDNGGKVLGWGQAPVLLGEVLGRGLVSVLGEVLGRGLPLGRGLSQFVGSFLCVLEAGMLLLGHSRKPTLCTFVLRVSRKLHTLSNVCTNRLPRGLLLGIQPRNLAFRNLTFIISRAF